MQMDVRYSDVVTEASAGNEVLFWRAVADAVAKMAAVASSKVSVMVSGELGNRVAHLNATRSDKVG